MTDVNDLINKNETTFRNVGYTADFHGVGEGYSPSAAAEAAVRIRRLAGLTLGANVVRGKAELVEAFAVEDYIAGSHYYQGATANRTVTTYGGYVGLDQTNPAGVMGFIRAGHQYRDVGRMPSRLLESDGVTSTVSEGETVWLDYSGFYVKVGVGFDLVR